MLEYHNSLNPQYFRLLVFPKQGPDISFKYARILIDLPLYNN
jgi:hypothetical protein